MDTKGISRVILLILFTISSKFSIAGPIIDGKEWRQLTETSGFSYNDLVNNSICNTATGSCSGTLNGIDFNGWTWASIFDVGSMFESVISLPSGTLSSQGSFTQFNSPWAPLFMDIDSAGPDTGLFEPTLPGFAVDQLIGITRDTLNGEGLLAWIVDARLPLITSTLPDSANTNGTVDKSLGLNNTGIWLFRDISTASVLEPMPILLLSSGLISIGLFRRKKLYS